MRILLIEDNPAGLRFLREKLNGKYGTEFQLIHPPSLPKTLQTLSEDSIDVVLVDIASSNPKKLDILSRIQSVDSMVPVVILANPEDEAAGLEALRLGAQDYLIKNNLDSHTLTRTLRCAIERKHFILSKGAEITGERDYFFFPPVNEGGSVRLPSPENAEKKKVTDIKPLNHTTFAEILENERVVSFFQSWVSLKEQAVVGFEGLCRGIGEDPGSLISPTTLLRYALHHRLLNSLDHLFRRKVFEGFRNAARLNPHLVLSVNFATSTLDDGEDAEEDFLSLTEEFQIDPRRIAIEILESHVHDFHRLRRFIQKQRNHGFLIALDDIGSGYSGLNRISELEPDLIKIDRSLVTGIHRKHHQQEVFKSVVRLARGIGAQTIAEGVETEDELMLALKLGADMVQGYYFSMPGEISEHLWGECGEKIYQATKKFRSYISGQINEKRSHYRKYDEIIHQMADRISSATPKGYDAELQGLLYRHPEVERLFVLDDGGAQLSLMVGRTDSPLSARALSGPFRRGTNHSAMDYFYYHIENGFQWNTFVTDPFLSPATGNRCVTVSTLFKNAYGHTSVLCADIRAGE